jgi:type I restriction-modification system DNA methylase subunit
MKKSKLGQFYTPEYISEIIAKQVTCAHAQEPLKILDMACGNGSLLTPLKRILSNSEFNAYDIDNENIKKLKSTHPSWNLQNVDSLTHTFKDNFYDISVGNPPFIKTHATTQMIGLIARNYDGLEIKEGNTIRSEIAFIAKYIESTKIGGMISLVIPESIISNEKMKFVRTFLFKNLNNISLYKIASKYFDSAEVNTYLITGKKSITSDSKIDVGIITENGVAELHTTVDKVVCVERADLRYLLNIKRFEKLHQKYLSVKDIILAIDRGNKTKAELEKENTAFFHTSSFNDFETSQIKLEGDSDLITRYRPKHVAQKSDIIIPRIGRSCHKKQVQVVKGAAVLTDSVFRIKVPPKLSDKVYESFDSEIGRLWRDINAKGSCTRMLTIQDILKMPLTAIPR